MPPTSDLKSQASVLLVIGEKIRRDGLAERLEREGYLVTLPESPHNIGAVIDHHLAGVGDALPRDDHKLAGLPTSFFDAIVIEDEIIGATHGRLIRAVEKDCVPSPKVLVLCESATKPETTWHERDWAPTLWVSAMGSITPDSVVTKLRDIVKPDALPTVSAPTDEIDAYLEAGLRALTKLFDFSEKARVRRLAEGFSRSNVLRVMPDSKVHVRDPNGGYRECRRFVAKVGSRESTEEEYERYRTLAQYFVGGSHPTVLHRYVLGHRVGGLSYFLCGDQEQILMLQQIVETVSEKPGSDGPSSAALLGLIIKNLFTDALTFAHRATCRPLWDLDVGYRSKVREYLSGLGTDGGRWEEILLQEVGASFSAEDGRMVQIDDADMRRVAARLRICHPQTAVAEWPSSAVRASFGVIHGDLHTRNVIVERQGHSHVFLIDFAHTGVGHVAADFAKLECDVKFSCRFPDLGVGKRLELESALTKAGMDQVRLAAVVSTYGKDGASPDQDAWRIALTVSHIRDFARMKMAAQSPWKEYVYPLFDNAVRYCSYPEAVSREARIQALYSMGLMQEEIMKWQRTAPRR